MTRVPLLLIESLDADGTVVPDDGRLRAAALRVAGFAPHLITLAPSTPGPTLALHHGAEHAPDRHTVAWRDGQAAVRAELAAQRFERVLVAAAAPGAEPVARWLPAGLEARWWPAGLHAGTRRMPWEAVRGLRPIGDRGQESRGAAAAAHAALDWCAYDEGALARRRLPLWDGDYLLVPGALDGASGEQLLAGFAALTSDHVALDLIVLADPQPAFERRARERGVGTRVHFVGAATREAEWSWLKPASGLLVAGPGPLAATVVARALACGCPILGLGSEGVGPALNAWLAARGAATSDEGAPAGALRRLLDRGAAVERAIERGRRASEAHRVASLATRLRAALECPAAAVAELPPRRAA